MKKVMLGIVLIFFIATASYSGQIKQCIYPEKTVSKNMSITIIQTNTYNFPVYARSSAMLDLMVIKLKGDKMDTLITKEYPLFKLKNLPSYSKGFNYQFQIPNVADSREQIIFLYTITYKSKKSILKIPSVHYIGKGATNDNFFVRI